MQISITNMVLYFYLILLRPHFHYSKIEKETSSQMCQKILKIRIKQPNLNKI